MLERDGAAVSEWIQTFRKTGTVSVSDPVLSEVRAKFYAARLNDADTKQVIRHLYAETGEQLDPHSAIGVGVARKCRGDVTVPMVSLATAHPSKFPDAVEEATGLRPQLPDRLATLFDQPERYVPISKELKAVQKFISETTTVR